MKNVYSKKYNRTLILSASGSLLLILIFASVYFTGNVKGNDSVSPALAVLPTPDPPPLENRVSEFQPFDDESFSFDPEAQSPFGAAVLTIEEIGLSADEISLPEGRSLLIIENKTAWDVHLKIKNSSEETLEDIVVPAHPHKWASIVNLASGVYQIEAPAQPQFSCEITVN